MLKYNKRSTAQAIGVGENPLNGNGKLSINYWDEDIVWTILRSIEVHKRTGKVVAYLIEHSGDVEAFYQAIKWKMGNMKQMVEII